MANLTGIKGPSQKPFRDALRAEIAAAGPDAKALRRVARALLAKAGDGDVQAITAVADRLDGKVAQPVGGSDELGPQRLQITWRPGAPEPSLQPEPANQIEEVPAPQPLPALAHQS